MQLRSTIQKLEPIYPFSISRGTKHYVENVLIEIDDGQYCGIGEAAPNRFYNENPVEIQNILNNLNPAIRGLCLENVEDIENAWKNFWPHLNSRAAQCALDVACWDYLARKKGLSVHRLALGVESQPLTSAVTAGLCSKDKWDDRIEPIKNFPIIKIKMDSSGNLDYLKYIAASSPKSRLWIDANCALTEETFVRILPDLIDVGVELIEQPFPPGKALPSSLLNEKQGPRFIADESCVVESDVKQVVRKFHGINIKLAKCGGLTPALRMIQLARTLGLKVMVGCMLESELIAAATVAAQLADYVDLDGNWLLKTKLFEGPIFKKGVLSLNPGPGLGLTSIGHK